MLRAGALLALGGTVAPLTGCDLFDRGDERDRVPDPLEPLAAQARELAARHRAALAAHPGLAPLLTPIADAHEAHAGELAKLTGRPVPSPEPSPDATATGDRSAVLAALREAEQRGRESAATLCAEAPADRAALVGSIAAARATHVEALR
ncbi:hypothetical protein [Micromonospora sp. ATCC 39149]|uniref:Ferritin-like domain-containing protein n=1 Tax=Micromonospora carbonacea TaxID=47853 RepID=A0A7D6GBG6_9ACTN|nr:hypothetical protein [Micromonospora sp. ATCC 39149]QLK01264.1 hypothetical protein HZU44_07330 [Micromonospora carbonacea]